MEQNKPTKQSNKPTQQDFNKAFEVAKRKTRAALSGKHWWDRLALKLGLVPGSSNAIKALRGASKHARGKTFISYYKQRATEKRRRKMSKESKRRNRQ